MSGNVSQKSFCFQREKENKKQKQKENTARSRNNNGNLHHLQRNKKPTG